MERVTHKVCVIGAGLSGLAATKCMLDAQFEVTCFEKDSNIAGRWNPESKNPIPPSTVTNLPHFLSGFSDFPVPDEFPLYLPASMYFQYFEMYAEKFNLREHVKLNCEVVSVVPCTRNHQERDGGGSGDNDKGSPGAGAGAGVDIDYWKVTIKNEHGIKKESEFDYVVVCSGMYQKEFVPKTILGALSGFSGEVVHALHYKSWHNYEGKNVVVCGLGNTGGTNTKKLALAKRSKSGKTVIIIPDNLAQVDIQLSHGGLYHLEREPNVL